MGAAIRRLLSQRNLIRLFKVSFIFWVLTFVVGCPNGSYYNPKNGENFKICLLTLADALRISFPR